MYILTHLQPGLNVEFEEQQHDIKGILVAFLGDTPAVNKAGGFKEGVSFALRKCRHCLATNADIQTKVNVFNMHAFYLLYPRSVKNAMGEK